MLHLIIKSKSGLSSRIKFHVQNFMFMLKVSSNKEQLIKMIVNRLCSMQPPPATDVITGPDPHSIHMGSGLKQAPLYHEEADVIMAFHFINESSSEQKNIRVVSDDTDVLVILAHHLYMKTKGLSQEVVLSIKSCTVCPRIM